MPSPTPSVQPAQNPFQPGPSALHVVMNQAINVPILKSLDRVEIQNFFKAFGRYRANHGGQHAVDFVDEGVKAYVSDIGFNSVVATISPDDLALYIYNLPYSS